MYVYVGNMELLAIIYYTRSELASLAHSFTPLPCTTQRIGKGHYTIISAFIAALHCACS